MEVHDTVTPTWLRHPFLGMKHQSIDLRQIQVFRFTDTKTGPTITARLSSYQMALEISQITRSGGGGGGKKIKSNRTWFNDVH